MWSSDSSKLLFGSKRPRWVLACDCTAGLLWWRTRSSRNALLQSYQQDEPTYDDNAYTLSATYHGGILRLYTTHLTKPEGQDRPEYIMHLIDVWAMVGNSTNFRQGATAYRNSLDWAEEKRNGFIRLANERQSAEQSQSRHERTASEVAATLEDKSILNKNEINLTQFYL